MNDQAFLAQYKAATTDVGLLCLKGWTTLRVSGADRSTFLHNMCTNDIRNLPPGGHCEALLTDVKGKIVGHVHVVAEADSLLMITVPDQADKLIAHLSRYIIREDVQLADESANICWWLAIGPASQALVKRLDAADSGVAVRPVHKFECDSLWVSGIWLGVRATEAKPADDLATILSDEVWHALRLESGWPLFDIDFDGSHLPQEIGRDAQAISFRKGCYLGQETVARIDALGHVNKRLGVVKLTEPAAVGANLTAGEQAVGRISSVAWSPQHERPIAMAMVRRGFTEPGSQLQCDGRPAEVIAPASRAS